jgi:hypothetical protein
MVPGPGGRAEWRRGRGRAGRTAWCARGMRAYEQSDRSDPASVVARVNRVRSARESPASTLCRSRPQTSRDHSRDFVQLLSSGATRPPSPESTCSNVEANPSTSAWFGGGLPAPGSLLAPASVRVCRHCSSSWGGTPVTRFRRAQLPPTSFSRRASKRLERTTKRSAGGRPVWSVGEEPRSPHAVRRTLHVVYAARRGDQSP